MASLSLRQRCLNSSHTTMRILPCLLRPRHSFLLMTLEERVAPHPHMWSGVTSTKSKSPDFRSSSCSSRFCSNFFLMWAYITTNYLPSHSFPLHLRGKQVFVEGFSAHKVESVNYQMKNVMFSVFDLIT